MKKYLYITGNEITQEQIDGGYEGFAVGSEYCYFLFPSKEEIELLLIESESMSKELTLILPCLKNGQIGEVVDRIKPFAGKSRIRLMVNDWGSLWTLSRELPGVEMTTGRLMSGQKWGVRVKSSPFLTDRGRRLLGSDIMASPSVREFFRTSFGVTKVGVNPITIDMEDAYFEHRIIHLPYSLVTVTDYCPYMGNLPSGLIPSCSAPCKKGYVTLSNPSLGYQIFLRGKGRFYNPFDDGTLDYPEDLGECIVYDQVP